MLVLRERSCSVAGRGKPGSISALVLETPFHTVRHRVPAIAEKLKPMPHPSGHGRQPCTCGRDSLGQSGRERDRFQDIRENS